MCKRQEFEIGTVTIRRRMNVSDNVMEPALPCPFGAGIDSVLLQLRDQLCPSTLKRPSRSCVSE